MRFANLLPILFDWFVIFVFYEFYIWGSDPLSEICFANIFSSLWLVFILLIVFITDPKVLNFLFFFFLSWSMLLVLNLNPIAKPKVSRFSPAVSSGNFSFAFYKRSVIHFELNFVKGVIGSLFRLIFLHVGVQLFQYYML